MNDRISVHALIVLLFLALVGVSLSVGLKFFWEWYGKDPEGTLPYLGCVCAAGSLWTAFRSLYLSVQEVVESHSTLREKALELVGVLAGNVLNVLFGFIGLFLFLVSFETISSQPLHVYKWTMGVLSVSLVLLVGMHIRRS